jgi:WD40 repeat protein
LDGPPTGLALRWHRAVELVEWIGTAEAKQLLERWGSGAKEARLTQEASKALKYWVTSREPWAMASGKPRLDAAGDLLPAGAVLRIGTNRWRGHGSQSILLFTPDGKRLIDVSRSGGIVVFDASDGKVLRRANFEAQYVHNAVLSADGSRLAVSLREANGARHFLKVWKLPDCQQIADIPAEGMVCFTSGTDEVLFQTAQGLEEVSIVTGEAVRQHPLPQGVISVSLWSLQGATAVAWLDSPNGSGGRLVAFKWRKSDSNRTLVIASAPLRCVAIHPNERELATVLLSGDVQILDLRTGDPLYKLSYTGDERARATSVQFSPNGNYLAVACRKNDTPGLWDVFVWDLRSRKPCWQAARAGRSPILAFSPDARLLATDGQPIGLFDVATGKRLNGDADAVRVSNAVFAADGTSLLTVQDDGAGLYEFPSGKPVRHFPHPGLWTAELSPDGHYVATTMLHHDLRIWDTRSSREMRLPDQGAREGAGRHLAFTTDSKHLLSWETDFRLLKWNVSNGRLVAEHQPRPAGFTPIDEDDEDGRRQLRRRRDRLVILRGRHGFSRDGTRLLWQFDDAYVYDTATGAEQRKFSMSFNVGAGEATADRDFEGLFVTVGNRIALIQLNNGRIFGELDGGRRDVSPFAAAISADGRLVAACLAEPAAEIRVWETASLGRRLTIPIEHGHVRRLDFSEDGRFLAGVHSDGTVLVWDLRGQAFR